MCDPLPDHVLPCACIDDGTANRCGSGEEEQAEDMAVAQEGSFGARVRRLREAAGLSQEELAERVGLSPSVSIALNPGSQNQPTRPPLLPLPKPLTPLRPAPSPQPMRPRTVPEGPPPSYRA